MAIKPSKQSIRATLHCLAVLLCGVMLSGCEMGRSMFQFSSDSIPWVGINLVPKRKQYSATEMSFKSSPDREQPNGKAIELTTPEPSDTGEFVKQPVRLDLPSSRERLTPTKLQVNPNDNFDVHHFADQTF